VWVEDAADHATRYTLDMPSDDRAWHEAVEPIFQRVCASCHLPGGDADLDLSTPGAWAFRRAEIVQRVLVERTMPPAGTDITDAERKALDSWLEHTP
jgi:mono/diheme cytochrome c family protein